MQLVPKFPDILFRTQKTPCNLQGVFCGAVEQIRTVDLFLTKEVLCLLSYNSIFSLVTKERMATRMGLEPTTSSVTG